jgi:hypothetical protein
MNFTQPIQPAQPVAQPRIFADGMDWPKALQQTFGPNWQTNPVASQFHAQVMKQPGAQPAVPNAGGVPANGLPAQAAAPAQANAMPGGPATVDPIADAVRGYDRRATARNAFSR